jgi:hypothetical protein
VTWQKAKLAKPAGRVNINNPAGMSGPEGLFARDKLILDAVRHDVNGKVGTWG